MTEELSQGVVAVAPAGANRFCCMYSYPIDVKRGVYIGELSRLAVLCSHKETYIGAVKDLNSLFQIRGYPVPLIMAWCKKNIQERWDKRFAIRNTDDPVNSEAVLVLKARYDDVWNWFSATELGNTITKYWEEWYDHAENNSYVSSSSRPFLRHDMAQDHDLTDVRQDLLTGIPSGVDGELDFVPDLRKIGLLGSRWLVSRKRNTNLFDLTNVWKKMVFQKVDEAIADEGGVDPMIPDPDVTHDALSYDPTDDLEEDIIIGHRRSESPDQDHPQFGRLTKRGN